jgi:exodeoxyribonuclease V beta subunit
VSADSGAPFAVDDPLPRGGLAIEASAGTGKTTALADLATRFLAESGVATSELLIVTFTRAATNELRTRVRNRLIEVADRLEEDDPTTATTGRGEVDPPDDPVVRLLASRDRTMHTRRLRSAAVEFDAATITTIHGFAVQVRSALGESVGIDPEVKLVDEGDQIVMQTCADVLAAASASGRPAVDLPTLSELGTATMKAASRPDMVLEPQTADQCATPAQLTLRLLVEQSVFRLDDRRRRQGTASFDSVLVDLCRALTGPGSEAAVESLRRRYRVALIDEFQDTDPVQWRIFERLFGEPKAGTTLVVVGDPKQAIYGFRGGDIETYIHAVKDLELLERRSMHANWRSDVAALTALDALFAGATFGDPSIRYVPVTAARPAQHRRLRDGSGAPLPPLSLRLAIDPGIRRTRNRTSSEVVVAAGARAIEEDLVARVRDLLDHATIPSAGEDGPPRPVRPKDIAVLVNRNEECTAVQSALADQGVPAVVAHGGNVFRSPAAQQMRWLLHAMGRPSDPRRARTYALSWFGGWSAAELDSSVDADLASLQEDLRTWSERLATHSVAEVLAQVWATSGVAAKVLAGRDGDRNMTDLEHVAELLHGSTPDGRAHVAGLLAFLDGAPDAPGDTDVDADITARRVESDAEAVQIMTVWTAKGLEFPIVCLPTLWRWQGHNDPVIYVDPDTGRRTFDLARGTTWPSDEEAKARKERAAREMAGERLRLLYVALTRARHQTIVWWANGQNSGRTALARVLFARKAEGIDPDAYQASAVAIPADDDIVESLAPLVEASGSTVAVHAVGSRTPDDERWSGGRDPSTDTPLCAANFTARLDRSPRRWSFSAITDEPAVAGADPFDPSAGDSGAADERLGQEVGAPSVSGVSGDDAPALAEAVGIDGSESALFELPAGARFGTLVHAVLEAIDFSVGPGLLESALGAGIDRQLARQPMDLTPSAGGTAAGGRSLLIQGLTAALRTPLGPLCAHRRLVDLPPVDLLREVSFDLRLGQGVRRPTVRDVGKVVVAHLRPDDPLVEWADRLATIPTDLVLTGHLTGSIDLVLRIDDEIGPSRFVVADYKTNALTLPSRTGRVGDYGPTRLSEAMASHDYPLQALLYLAALHRYLRWRLRDYRPTLHLGGAVYLFLRGMTGPSDGGTTEPAGVFSWPVPPALVVALSDLLEGRPVGESAS